MSTANNKSIAQRATTGVGYFVFVLWAAGNIMWIILLGLIQWSTGIPWRDAEYYLRPFSVYSVYQHEEMGDARRAYLESKRATPVIVRKLDGDTSL